MCLPLLPRGAERDSRCRSLLDHPCDVSVSCRCSTILVICLLRGCYLVAQTATFSVARCWTILMRRLGYLRSATSLRGCTARLRWACLVPACLSAEVLNRLDSRANVTARPLVIRLLSRWLISRRSLAGRSPCHSGPHCDCSHHDLPLALLCVSLAVTLASLLGPLVRLDAACSAPLDLPPADGSILPLTRA